jgi:hypothetical protein
MKVFLFSADVLLFKQIFENKMGQTWYKQLENEDSLTMDREFRISPMSTFSSLLEEKD